MSEKEKEHKRENTKSTIRCPVCGLEYSVTYKECPFCAEDRMKEKGKQQVSRRGGGYRRKSGARGVVITVVIVIIAFLACLWFYLMRSDLLPWNSASTSSVTVSESASASASESSEAASSEAVVLTLDTQTITLHSVGETYALQLTMTPENPDAQVDWTSSDDSVATVSDSGIVIAVNEGSAVISVSASGATTSCVVNCSFTEASSTEETTDAAATSLPLQAGDTGTINADIANLRSEPNQDSDANIIATVAGGVVVTINSAEGEWYNVTFESDGQTYTGYILGSLVS